LQTGVKNKEAKGWLCPALFRYFETAPESLFVKAEPSHRQFNMESELEALKDRVENLERLVGKLILQYDLLKKRWRKIAQVLGLERDFLLFPPPTLNLPLT
jgi:hypothetical protein